MTKINYLRNRMKDEYESRKLEDAAIIGHTLIDEQEATQHFGKAFSDDLFNLALVYDELSQLDIALEFYAKSAHYLPNDDALAVAMRASSMAGVLARMGSRQVAAHFYSRARSIYSNVVGESHPSYADTLYNLGNLHALSNQRIPALRAHKKALKIREEAGTPEDILHSLHSIAFLFEDKGDKSQAANYAEAAVLHAKRHGTDADYSSACNYYAQILESTNQHEKALEMYACVLEKIAAMGCTRDTYADCLKNMAKINQHIGDTAHAEKCMVKALKAREFKSKERINDICFLIQLYLQDDTYDKAVRMLVYALAGIDEAGESADTAIDALLDALATAGDKTRLMEMIDQTRDLEKIREALDGVEGF